MLSKSSRLRFLHRLRLLRLSRMPRMPRMRISVKLTLVYAVLMVVLLFATCAFTAVGIYYTQYHQVERELSFSIFDAVQQLMRDNYQDGTPVRLIGVTVSSLKKDDEIIEQQDLFGDDSRKVRQQELNRVMDKINARYGGDTVHRARKLTGWDKNGELF